MAKFDPKLKKPTLKGMSNTGHLGHFAKDKFIQQGHNDSGPADSHNFPSPCKNGENLDDCQQRQSDAHDTKQETNGIIETIKSWFE